MSDLKVLKTNEVLKLLKNKLKEYKQLHIHHTYNPSHSDYDGSKEKAIQLQKSIKNYHVNVNDWSDIGYHLTLFPDGRWVTGRDLNRYPASIKDWNKKALSIVLLGNFDTGNDTFDHPQSTEIIKLCAEFIKAGHDYDKIKFHRDGPNVYKTCPGSNIKKSSFIESVRSEVESKKDFKGHWAEKEIKKVIEKGIFKKTDKFRPDDPVTRAEIATIIVRLLNEIG